MGLLDDALELTERRKGPPCTVGALPDDLYAEVTEAIGLADGRTLTLRAVAQAVKDRGHQTSAGALGRHRSGECACDNR